MNKHGKVLTSKYQAPPLSLRDGVLVVNVVLSSLSMFSNAFGQGLTDADDGVHGVRDDGDHDAWDHDSEDHASRDRTQHRAAVVEVSRRRTAVAVRKWGHGVALPRQWVRRRPDSRTLPALSSLCLSFSFSLSFMYRVFISICVQCCLPIEQSTCQRVRENIFSSQLFDIIDNISHCT